ncbi:hypothetical protein ACJ41O_006314 [Fusarium nematophilum]
MAGDPPFCTKISPECPIEYTVYGYRPNLWANGFFAVFFGICFVVHIWLGIRFRTRSYTIALTLGCLGQVLGYVGRIGLYYLPFHAIPFQMQVCCLIIAPAFNSAAIYLMLKHIVEIFGPEWSVLAPKQYTTIFITADVISLVLQATGGGLSATAGTDNKDQFNLGNNIMMAGVSFQVATLTVFAALTGLFLVRRVRARSQYPIAGSALETWNSTKFRWFISGLLVAFVAIFTRCVYRIAEMEGGWGNSLMRDEITFILLEGLMIVIATMAQTVLHPGYFFPKIVDSPMRQGTWSELPIISKS